MITGATGFTGATGSTGATGGDGVAQTATQRPGAPLADPGVRGHIGRRNRGRLCRDKTHTLSSAAPSLRSAAASQTSH